MRWILRMAWRDSRGSRRRLLVFLSSIVIGVAALVAINGFGDNLEESIDEQAQTLLGADLSLESDVPFGPEMEAMIDSIGGQQARRVSLLTMASFPTSGSTRLVSLRGVSGDFPFYGALETVPPDAARRYQRDGGAIVDATLLDQLGVAVGDSVRLGNHSYAIIGRLTATSSEPAAVMLFSPRIYVRLPDVDPSLLGQGSLAEYEVFFRLPPETDPEALREQLQPQLRTHRVGIDTVQELKEEWDDALTNLYRFLGLIALTALLLGGLGVGSAVHLYVRRRLDSVAVLRCLGASRRRTNAVYVTQALALGAIGSAAGCLIGLVLQLTVPAVLGDFLPVDVAFGISWPAIALGFAAGVSLTLVFALLPLATIADVSPLAAIRRAVESGGSRSIRRRGLLLVFVAVVAGTVVVLQAPQPQVGIAYAIGLLLVFAGLAALGGALRRLARAWMPQRAPYTLRQGLSNLYRPGNQTLVLMVALGLGSFIVLVMIAIHGTLLSQLQLVDDRSRANVVFFDVQPGEVEGVSSILEAQAAPVLDRVPIVSMRIERINGESVAAMEADSTTHVSWAHRRDYRSTYRGTLSDTERLVAGRFTGALEPGQAPVPISVEVDVARELNVDLGDTIVWNVHGLPIETVVGSLREVDWNRMSANFFIVFPEGILEEAPRFFVVLTRAADAAQSARLQREVVSAYPTVSAIDLELVAQVFETLYSRAAFVIRFMVLFSILTGLIVLAGAVLATRYERSREAVLLKALGAARRQVGRIMLVEYFFVGLFASVAGLALAFGAGWALAAFLFETRLVMPLVPAMGTVLIIIALTVAIGAMASRGTYDQSVLSVLRAEA